jgi:hypothetical protein
VTGVCRDPRAARRAPQVVWNEIDIYKNAPSAVSGLLTPAKATQA